MRSNLVGHLGCVIAFSAATAALAGGGGPVELNDPFQESFNLFGARVSAVGSDKVIVGAPGANLEVGGEGEAFLFDVDGTLLQTYFAPQVIEDERFGWDVCGVGDSAVLICSIPDGLPGVVYLYDLNGNELDSFSSPSASADDNFCVCAAVGTDTAVIAAAGDDTDGPNSGRAFVFDLTGGEGGGPTIIANPNPSIGAFGMRVAALGGDRVAIAAQNFSKEPESVVYVFQLPAGNLVQTIPNPSPSLSGLTAYGSDQLLIGGTDEAIYLFDIATGDLDLTIPDPDGGFSSFGARVAALGNGTIAVSDPAVAPDAWGVVYLFDSSGTQLDLFNHPEGAVPGDSFGSGSLAALGCNQLAVGSPLADEFKVAVDAGDVWLYSDLAGGNCSNNYVELYVERIDDFEQVEAAFRAEINVVIPDNPAVLGVSFGIGESSLGLTEEQDNHWSGELHFFDIDDLTNNLNGFGFIDTFGTAESGGGIFTSTIFDFDGALLLESDFFATPTNVDPADGSVDVPIDTNFSWDDPTGIKDSADILAVTSEPEDGGDGSQEDNSLFGSLSVSDTTWDPPQDLLPGPNRFEVAYLNFDDAGLASQLMVKSGAISWGDSPLAPKGYPESTALVTLGSSTHVGFGAAPGGIGTDPPEITPAAGIPEHESTGDYDGDGDTDVVVTIPDLDPANEGVIQVFLNQGTDEFEEWLGFEAQPTIPVGREPTWVTTGNFNFDNAPDLCVTNAGDNNVSIFLNLNDGTGNFGPEINVFTGNRPSSCTTGQFNGLVDPFLDIAVTNEDDADLVILFNDGLGNFTLGGGPASAVVPIGVRAVSMTSGDFDGNKCPDAVGSGDAVGLGPGGVGQVFVVLGDGNGGFGPPILVGVGADPRDISVGDFNDDTLNDIIVANRGDGTISVVLNLGGGAFDTPVTIPVDGNPRSIDAVNLDADGDPDIAVVAEGTSTVQVLVNRAGDPVGFGSSPVILDPPVSFPVGGNPNFVVHTDLDDDGISDLCMVNQDNSPNEGSLSALLIDLFPEEAGECPADLNGDDFVNIADFFVLLESWGPCETPCDADLDGDGHVGILDLLALVGSFGPCLIDRCPWDIDGNMVVDFADLLDVLMHVGDCADQMDCPWDLDGDGFVGLVDVLAVLGNFGPCPE